MDDVGLGTLPAVALERQSLITPLPFAARYLLAIYMIGHDRLRVYTFLSGNCRNETRSDRLRARSTGSTLQTRCDIDRM